ncbi:unnamed protein product [Acanthoscelides obtectus]|uniref:CCR4-NOT transcription complex subunit 3 n=1 Tax=Acanthoscelides obtectus TaxID=200917 RepID=A0A9P0Q0J7_ACAOB|nr:unnamed protein product [Acanthoscelides obtectus]CAK1636213.1 CCR4-NOT transcription complex subunit 3 [Acanthoscelides obtectus]
MAATRKLQGEIDRCLKKVTEGVETFEDIWQKVHNATNSNQKEKYEADLKKEIKKLQRLRDQIKSWIASAEIKDKSILMDNRKLIETQMERFKVVERETKTKAYSKEGLGAAQKLDPAQKERDEIQHWLVCSIDQLNIQTDAFESEIELLLSNKKKKLDKDKQDRLDELKSRLERHRFHIRKLETLLRMLDNMSVEVQQIKRIKDNVEYYIESSQEPDFEDNEFIYDDIIGLDEVELSGVGLPSSATTDSNDTGGTPTSIISGSSPVSSPPPPPPPLPLGANGTSSGHPSNDIGHHFDGGSAGVVGAPPDSSTPAANAPHANTPAAPAAAASTAPTILEKKTVIKEHPKPVKPTPVRASVSLAGGSAVSHGASASASNHSSASMATVTSSSTASAKAAALQGALASAAQRDRAAAATDNSPVAPPSMLLLPPPAAPSVGQTGAGTSLSAGNFAAAVAATNNPHHKHSTSSSGDSNPSSVITIVSQVQSQNTLSNAVNTSVHTNPILSVGSQNAPNVGATSQKAYGDILVQSNCLSPEVNVAKEQQSHQTIDPMQPTTNGLPIDKISDGMTSLKSMAQQVIDQAGLQISDSDEQQQQQQQQQVSILEASKQQQQQQQQNQGRSEAHIPPLLGVAPLGAVPLQKEHQQQFKLMEAAFYHMPHPSDSERIRTYLPRTPCTTPSYYIQTPLPHSDTLEFFQRLATETLFFVFYYMEGTKAQYLAAKALKKQSWRFHTKYMMWFQRHEEPKIINEEFEQGTYIYFDYEKWGQRKKEGFTFEYKYLEDRDLN